VSIKALLLSATSKLSYWPTVDLRLRKIPIRPLEWRGKSTRWYFFRDGFFCSNMADKDSYVLYRSYCAACRLNYQSYLWREILGFYLHPSIPPLKDGTRIADVATGTGAWMLGLNREAPVHLRLDGMDINLAQAPLKQWLPPNINMRT